MGADSDGAARAELCLRARDLRFGYAAARGDARGFELALPAFDLAWGESVACVGPSGSGKTTLASLLAGVRVPDAGEVCFDGAELSALPDAVRRALRIRRFGLVFQELELIPWLDARDNIVLPYRTTRELVLSAAVWERAEALAARVGVAQLLRRKPGALSQGERQRVAICRALIHEPALVFCDEPTGNLDEESARASIAMLSEDCAARGASFFCITHDRSLLGGFDRVLELGGALEARAEAPRG